MSQSPVFRGVVDQAGKLRLDDRARFDACLSEKFKGKAVVVTVKAPQSQRSLDQNAWIWAVAYPVIADALGYDKHEIDDLHYALMEKCWGTKLDARLRVMVPNKRSSKLTTAEFSEYMEWLVRFAATERGGIMVPLPGESEAA